MVPGIRIRPAEERDLRAAAELAALLVHMHHQLDPRRFAILSDDIAGGYERWLRQCLSDSQAVVLVARRAGPAAGEGALLGYAYGSIEPRNWNDLLDTCGMLHDVIVEPAARGDGVGTALIEAIVRQLTARGAPRVVLKTAAVNTAAQRLFARLGFRPTMIEMTREA